MRAARPVQVLSPPSPIARLPYLFSGCARAVTLGGLVEQAELSFPLILRQLLTWRNNSNHLPGRDPLYLITRADAVLVRNGFG